MATRGVMADIAAAFEHAGGERVHIESVGGVTAAERVRAGEHFDLVLLASDAIDGLIEGGQLLPASRVDLMRSPVAMAVAAGAPWPDVGSASAVQQAVLAARRIGMSTGPSGAALARLFERWGIAAEVRSRSLQAQPGMPVGRLVATGEVDLGFQQLSELMGLDGIEVVGLLPAEIAIVTTFSAGVPADCKHPAAVQALLDFMHTPQAAEIQHRHGMEAAASATDLRSPGVSR